MLEEAACLANDVTKLELDRLKMRLNSLARGRLHGAKQPIAPLRPDRLTLIARYPQRQTHSDRNPSPAGGFWCGDNRRDQSMSAVVVRAMFRSHPDKPPHSEIMSRCIDACFDCVETCTACADACLSERDVGDLVACIRLNLDCAAVCGATGSIMSRSNKAGQRQLLEAHLANCIAFCRACADECDAHGDLHQHCAICAKTCLACAKACNAMLEAMRMPA